MFSYHNHSGRDGVYCCRGIEKRKVKTKIVLLEKINFECKADDKFFVLV